MQAGWRLVGNSVGLLSKTQSIREKWPCHLAGHVEGLPLAIAQELRVGEVRKREGRQGEEWLAVSGVPSPVARTFLGERFTYGLVLAGTLEAA